MIKYKSVLACVTQQKSCERLIHTAADYLGEDGSLYVIHVSKENWNFIDDAKAGEAMEYLFSVSKSYGADLTILHSDRIVETIAQFAQHYAAEMIVIGEAPEGNPNEFADMLRSFLDDSNIRIQTISTESVKTH